MTSERDDPFYDLGYTTPEDAARLRNDRILKASEKVVGATTASPRRYSRPPVGEEGHLLNVDDEPEPMTSAEAEAQTNGVWAQREQSIYDTLYRRWRTAVDNKDTVGSANLQAELLKRDARQIELGRPLIIPTEQNE